MKEKNEKPIEGYDFSLKKEEIKRIFNTPDYQDYKEKKKKTQKRKEFTYKFTSLGNSTHAVRNLIIVNVVLFLLTYISPSFISQFALFNIADPSFMPWQPLTYMFLHANLFHILINMLVLWSFANPLEQILDTKKLLIIYFLGGILGGVLAMFTAPLGIPTVGASGAICALLGAFVLISPDSKILLFFFIPMKMKYGVYGFAAVSLIFGLLSLINPSWGGPISHFGHLGGIVGGWLITYYWKTKKLIPTF